MTPRYVLAPQAARDLVQIWRYVKREVSQEAADRVESVNRTKGPRSKEPQPWLISVSR
jgi:plasmid stabilization system protein ParE